MHHKDGDKANNRLDNLEYVTQRENMLYSHAGGNRRSCAAALSKPVAWRQIGSANWTSCASVTQVAQLLGISRSSVSRACKRHFPVKGYEFQFQEPSDPLLPGEEWRPMLGPTAATVVPGRAISSFGRVTSKRGVISKGHLEQSGYYTTRICTPCYKKRVPVHRLVALAFLKPPESDSVLIVNHKDLDKTNNCVENLEWVSQAENTAHFHANASVVRVNGVKPIFSRVRGSNDSWKLHPSITSAARELGLPSGSISNCVLGKYGHVRGHEFKSASFEASLPGEEWRVVDLDVLKRDRKARTT